MLRSNKHNQNLSNILPLFGLSTFFLLLTACGGGGSGSGNSEASAIGIEDVSIAYIKRPTPRDQNDDIVSNDMLLPTTFSEGGDLYLQARASSNASTINITRRVTNGLGDVKDVNVSYDGTKLVFFFTTRRSKSKR